MVTTIERLEKGKFTVEQWRFLPNPNQTDKDPYNGEVENKYDFHYDKSDKSLYISGGELGNKQHKVFNPSDVLFSLAHGYRSITIILKEFTLNIKYVVLRLDS